MSTYERLKKRMYMLMPALAIMIVGLLMPGVVAKAEAEFKAGQAFRAGDTITFTPSVDLGNNSQSTFMYYDDDETHVGDCYTGGDSSYVLAAYNKSSWTPLYPGIGYNLHVAPATNFMGWMVMEDSTHDPNDNAAANGGLGAMVTLKLKAIGKGTTSCKILYDLDGGTNDSTNPTTYVCGIGYPKETFKAPTKKGYTFAGWSLDGELPATFNGISATTIGDVTLHANWKVEQYNITYDLDGGTHTGNPATYTYGVGVASFNPATKENFDFVGWVKVVPGTIDETPVTSISATESGDVTLKAKYKAKDSGAGKESGGDKSGDGSSKKPMTAKDLEKYNAGKSEADIANSQFGMLCFRSIKYTNNSITFKWKKVEGADGYLLYGNQCNNHGKKYNYKYVTTIKASKSTYVAKKLKGNKYYKYYLAAYKNVNGEKEIICTSKTVHATTVSPKFGVAQKISLNKKKVSLAAGKTFTIKAKEVNKNRKIASHRSICFESSDKEVAKVNSEGKITAVAKGKCKIWIYAQNGMYTYVNMTVK